VSVTYGFGQEGCLYDYGPHEADTVADAIDCLVETLGFYFDAMWERHDCEGADANDASFDPELEESRMRAALASDHIFRFSHPQLAGAHYCEVTP
jgi:hypothetical protein